MSKFSLANTLDKISKKTDILIEKDVKEKEYLSTGIYMLNAVLCGDIFGGLLRNKILALAGESGAGKSFLCYNTVRTNQRRGYHIIYIDTEQSIDLVDFENYGIDTTNNFTFLRVGVIEDLRTTLTQLIDSMKESYRKEGELDKYMIVVDSVGQMASRKEKDDAVDGKEKRDMTRASAIGSLFRIINNDLGMLNVPLILTNHTYDTMDLFSKTIMKGGKGLRYTCSNIVFVTKAKFTDGNEDEHDVTGSGITVTIKSDKNRNVRSKKFKIVISFEEGCNPFRGLEYFCTPENFDSVGIAKGKYIKLKKPIIDEETGEEITHEFNPTGNKYYVKHLDKSFYEKELFNSKIFTKEVLINLRSIIKDYISFGEVDYNDIEVFDMYSEGI